MWFRTSLPLCYATYHTSHCRRQKRTMIATRAILDHVARYMFSRSGRPWPQQPCQVKWNCSDIGFRPKPVIKNPLVWLRCNPLKKAVHFLRVRTTGTPLMFWKGPRFIVQKMNPSCPVRRLFLPIRKIPGLKSAKVRLRFVWWSKLPAIDYLGVYIARTCPNLSPWISFCSTGMRRVASQSNYDDQWTDYRRSQDSYVWRRQTTRALKLATQPSDEHTRCYRTYQKLYKTYSSVSFKSKNLLTGTLKPKYRMETIELLFSTGQTSAYLTRMERRVLLIEKYPRFLGTNRTHPPKRSSSLKNKLRIVYHCRTASTRLYRHHGAYYPTRKKQ